MNQTQTTAPAIPSLPQEPPANRIFATLRTLWKDQERGRRYQDLADHLTAYLGIKVTPQKLSQWATGSDNRRPPWAAIYWLMHATGYDVKLTTSGAKLQKVAAKEAEKLSNGEIEAREEAGAAE